MQPKNRYCSQKLCSKSIFGPRLKDFLQETLFFCKLEGSYFRCSNSSFKFQAKNTHVGHFLFQIQEFRIFCFAWNCNVAKSRVLISNMAIDFGFQVWQSFLKLQPKNIQVFHPKFKGFFYIKLCNVITFRLLIWSMRIVFANSSLKLWLGWPNFGHKFKVCKTSLKNKDSFVISNNSLVKKEHLTNTQPRIVWWNDSSLSQNLLVVMKKCVSRPSSHLCAFKNSFQLDLFLCNSNILHPELCLFLLITVE